MDSDVSNLTVSSGGRGTMNRQTFRISMYLAVIIIMRPNVPRRALSSSTYNLCFACSQDHDMESDVRKWTVCRGGRGTMSRKLYPISM